MTFRVIVLWVPFVAFPCPTYYRLPCAGCYTRWPMITGRARYRWATCHALPLLMREGGCVPLRLLRFCITRVFYLGASRCPSLTRYAALTATVGVTGDLLGRWEVLMLEATPPPAHHLPSPRRHHTPCYLLPLRMVFWEVVVLYLPMTMPMTCYC